MTASASATSATTTGGVATARGFRASGISAGIKAKGLDLALLVSDTPATAAAVFTINKAEAAPVVVSREHLSRSGGTVRAVVVNSGCANACTGDEGMNAAREMAAETARLVGCPRAGAGRIDQRHRCRSSMAEIRRLPQAFSAQRRQGPQAARAIVTTDPFPKAATQLTAGGREVTIGGMAKGSGMIEPCWRRCWRS
jgi:glutamate N-acetyltransferase/amino-acid N-acetyltransferase